MKKLFISLILALISIADIKAQDVQLATLQKGEDTQIFYGSNAFKEAMAAAEHGNTITLSPGTFNATTINKAVTIYGAGYEIEVDKEKLATEPAKYPTRINGDFSIALDSIDGQPAKGLYIEGVYSNNTITVTKRLVEANFVKCRFEYFRCGYYSDEIWQVTENCSFIQCKVADRFFPGHPISMVISNSIINKLIESAAYSFLMVQNSVIILMSEVVKGGVIKNSIIGDIGYEFDRDHVLAGDCSLHSNVCPYHNIFGNAEALNKPIIKDGNWIDTSLFTTLFGKDGIKEYSDTYSYQLTDEAKKTYIGTDGTEIGIYGGETPFSPVLTIPRITQKEIAPKTENGKLKVNIKVEIGDNSL